jgi:ribonucleoside-triphosphate reductase
MKIEDLKQELEEHNLDYREQCHDCGTSVSVLTAVTEEGAIAIEGCAVYKIKQGADDLLFFKCDDCFRKDHTLKSFRECLVYSRVVGYLRPVSGWNKGKLEEFKQRKLFENTEGK